MFDSHSQGVGENQEKLENVEVNKNVGKKILKNMLPTKVCFKSCTGTHPMLCYTSKQPTELLCRANAWLVKAEWSPDTCLQNWGGGGGGRQFYLGKRMNKLEHDGIGTCARIKISQRP